MQSLSIGTLFSFAVCAQVISPGDLVIVGYNFKDPDEFSMLTLINLQAGTQVYITDAGWDANIQAFRKSEGIITYTVPAGGILAGSQIVYPHDLGFSTQGVNGFFGLALAGDQLFIYQGSSANPSFIFGISDYNGFWQVPSIVIDNQTSHLPNGLSIGSTALVLNQYLQAHFRCTDSFANKLVFLAELSNPAYWLKDPVRAILPNSDCDFTSLPAQDQSWTYRWLDYKTIAFQVLHPQTDSIRWMLYNGKNTQYLSCSIDDDSYVCSLKAEKQDQVLVRPCFYQKEQHEYGEYQSIALEHAIENDNYYTSVGSGSIELHWRQTNGTVAFVLYTCSGQYIQEQAYLKGDHIAMEGLKIGCYVLKLIKDNRVYPLKIMVLD